MLSRLPKFCDPNLLVGFEHSDDGAVYRINDTQAMIQTVDFFPPIVDDPYTFGQIAACNALSDIYAMGGHPTLAMNLIAFPSCLPLSIMEEILQGGYAMVQQSGAIIAGGHTIEDDVPKYGLCVTGLAHPRDILSNSGAREGELLVLSKPLGTGVLSTAAMAELLTPDEYKQMIALMCQLNKAAFEAIQPHRPSACTDITGFGFLGHTFEMAQGSDKTIEIFSDALPMLPKALELAHEGIVPEGAYRNRDYLTPRIALPDGLSTAREDLLFDPQTSGGLLVSLPEDRARALLPILEQATGTAAIVGQVLPRGDKALLVR